MPSDNHQVVRTNSKVNMTDWERRLALDPSAAAPLYHQLRERLRTLVRECEPETLLPTERALMAYASVSRATARRAIADLVQEGLLITRQGSGTYTAPGRVPTELGRRPAGFTETMLRLGRRPATKLIEAQLVAAPPDIANRLNLADGAQVVVVERLRLLDDQPCMLERAHLSADLFPGLLDSDLTGSLYDILRSRYGLAPASGTESIMAINADSRLARRLDVPVAAALIATARTTKTTHGTVLEHTIRHARGDMCSFFVELNDANNALTDHSTADPMLTSVAGET